MRHKETTRYKYICNNHSSPCGLELCDPFLSHTFLIFFHASIVFVKKKRHLMHLISCLLACLLDYAHDRKTPHHSRLPFPFRVKQSLYMYDDASSKSPVYGIETYHNCCPTSAIISNNRGVVSIKERRGKGKILTAWYNNFPRSWPRALQPTPQPPLYSSPTQISPGARRQH